MAEASEFINIDSIVKQKCPELRLGCIHAKVEVQAQSTALWSYIQSILNSTLADMTTADIGQIPSIQSTRRGYKALGKDPARYRPSAEALIRRVVQGKGLYQINNVIDLLNLVSIQSGFSIGGYDAQQIQAPALLGIGQANEPYEGIGRGSLNIEYLPVFRDQSGPFGTPTSDSMRTRVQETTSHFLMAIFSFNANEALEAAMDDSVALLERYAAGQLIKKWIVE